MGRVGRSAKCLGCVVVALALIPSAAVAAPTIDGESVSGLTETNATLEALINPANPEIGALYQFQITPQGGEFAPAFTCPAGKFPSGSSLCLRMKSQVGALPLGVTAPSSEDLQVSLDLASHEVTLQPGTAYDYRVIAATDVLTFDVIAWEEPIVYGVRKTFTTPSVQPPAEEGSDAKPPTEEEPVEGEPVPIEESPRADTRNTVEAPLTNSAWSGITGAVNRKSRPRCHRARHRRHRPHRGVGLGPARKLCRS